MNKEKLDNVKNGLINQISENGKVDLEKNPRKKEKIKGIETAFEAIEALINEETSQIESLKQELVNKSKASKKVIARNKTATKAATIKRQQDFKKHYGKMAVKAEYWLSIGRKKTEITELLNKEGFRTQKGMELTPTHINRLLPLIRQIQEEKKNKLL